MILVIAAMAAAVSAAPATAQTGRAGPDTKICHKITYTGSRLGATSICKTKHEWDELQWEHDHLLREQQQLDRALQDTG